MSMQVTIKERREPREQQGESRRGSRTTRHRAAFTLVEVMVALGVFFMALFTILGLVSNSLRNARALQRKTMDCAPLAAQKYFELSNTNQVYGGLESVDFGDMYPDFEGVADVYPVDGTNGLGLLQVDMIVQRKQGGVVESKMSILVFPDKATVHGLDQGMTR
jgi:type II secretory pathway pseudopilin PulG